jgi:hypothetical protein
MEASAVRNAGNGQFSCLDDGFCRALARAAWPARGLFGGSMITGSPTVGRCLVGSLFAIARLSNLPAACDDRLGITNALNTG